MTQFTIAQLMKAGAHFGHSTRRWNPKIAPYIYGARNGIHIINLDKTAPMFTRALEAIRQFAAEGRRILFVGTKRAAQDYIRDTAVGCGQYYVNHRWLGGMLTNWTTITDSIRRLKELNARIENSADQLTKKELLNLTRERDKLENALGGIRDMAEKPDLLVIIDIIKEHTALSEARKLGIPVVAVVDSNADPEQVDYPIPGNDDAARSIELYCDLFKRAVLEGLAQEALLVENGLDSGHAVGDGDASAAPPAPEAPPPSLPAS